MLTEEQINQLQPLTKHEKYGKLLVDAIEVWKIADPIQEEFGVVRNEEENELSFAYQRPSCCLIGAASFNKEGPDSYLDDGDYAKLICKNSFGISYTELDGLIRGFDNDFNSFAVCSSYSQEAFDFASEVRKIIFGE